jgi:O-antigen/teichoic acid export membrane protein
MSILLCAYFNLNIVYSIISITFLEIVLTLYLIFDEKLSLVKRASINIHQLKEFIVFGIKANLTVIINNVMRRFDYFIITSFLGVSVLGKYSVALIFFTLVLSIPQAINGLLFGELTRKEKPKKQIFNLLWVIFLISSFIGIILMFLVKPFLSIFYGIEFIDVAPVARILIIAGIIQGSSGIFKVSLISKNKSQLNNLEQLITGIVQIFLMYLIIERFNLVGIAYSILLGSIVSFILRYFFYEKN